MLMLRPRCQNTAKRSALRITRESELLGGQLTSYNTREAVVLEAHFLREHLPYYTELLGEVVASTKFDCKNSPPRQHGSLSRRWGCRTDCPSFLQSMSCPRTSTPSCT